MAMKIKEQMDKEHPGQFLNAVVVPDSVEIVEMFPGFSAMYRDAVAFLQTRFKE